MALDKYISKKYTNISTSLIQITEDKLELILEKDINKVRKTSDLGSAFGIFLSLLIAVLTTNEYKEQFCISGMIWAIVFKLALWGSLGYLMYRIYCLIRYHIQTKDIIDHIKNNNSYPSI